MHAFNGFVRKRPDDISLNKEVEPRIVEQLVALFVDKRCRLLQFVLGISIDNVGSVEVLAGQMAHLLGKGLYVFCLFEGF